jgi:Mg-chelatase subunit ChlD
MTNVNRINNAKRVIAGMMSLILGKQCTVKWGHPAACDPNGVIMLPRPKTGDASEVALLTRQAVHETGHIAFSDFRAFEGLDDNVLALVNALEDPRIEHAQAKIFPGAALILNRGLEDAIQSLDALLDADNPAHRPTLVTANVLIKGCRKLVAHKAMAAGANGLVAKGDQVLGDRGLEAVNHAVDQLPKCRDTADVVTLATGLWTMLQSASPPQTEPSDQAEQDPGDAEPIDDEAGKTADAGEASGQTQPDSGATNQEQEAAQNNADEPQPQGSSATSPVDSSEGGGAVPVEEDQPGEDLGQAAQTPSVEASDEAPHNDAGLEGAASGDDQHEPNEEQGVANGDDSGDGSSTEEHREKPIQSTEQGSQTLELESAKDADMGKLLAMAYEQKFGKPDVDDQPSAVSTDLTPSTEELTQLVEQAMNQALEAGKPLESALDLIEEAMEVAVVAQAGSGRARDKRVPSQASPNLSGSVSRLARVFRLLLQDKRRRTVKLAPAGGQVASSRVWRLKAMGDTSVFKISTSVSGIETAATILLDRSGSMYDCIVEAASAAVSCAHALERISKVHTSIEMFPGTEHNTVTLQAFGQSIRQVMQRVNEVYADGGTPLAEALSEALPKLLSQRVKRRVVILITDGIPDDHEAALVEIATANSMGVDFVGIGIGEYGKAIESLVPASVCISDATELPDAFESLFRGSVALKLAA